MDDHVWKYISSLPSLHHHSTTTHHFQDFLAPAAQPTLHHPSPPQPPPPPPPLTTLLSLSTSSNSGNDQEPPHSSTNAATTGTTTSPHVFKLVKQTSDPQYTEKFKRLMKNRESAARSRARKQARADELEHEVLRLAKENAKLKRLQKELFSVSTTQVFKMPMLHRTRSAPF